MNLASLARLWRRAGPATPIPVPAKVAIVPAKAMPNVDRRIARIKRLREVIPQFEWKIAKAERAQGAAAAGRLVEKRRELQKELAAHELALKADLAGI